jgi:hypothetical protein
MEGPVFVSEKDRPIVEQIKSKLEKEGFFFFFSFFFCFFFFPRFFLAGLSISCPRLGGDMYIARFARARKHNLEDAFDMLKKNLLVCLLVVCLFVCDPLLYSGDKSKRWTRF